MADILYGANLRVRERVTLHVKNIVLDAETIPFCAGDVRNTLIFCY